MLYLSNVHVCTHLAIHGPIRALSKYKAILAPCRHGSRPAAVSHSPRWCFHSQDRLSAWGYSAFRAPGVKTGRNVSQKCLPPGWFSSALLCSEDKSRAQGKGTGKPRCSLTKLCLPQDRLMGGEKDMDHHTGMLQAPGTQLAEKEVGCWC